jgi:CheY-like chemotaxis protein
VPPTALIVDPDAEALAHTMRLLSDAGYAIASASSFAAARTLVALVRPDVLVTTLRLQGLSGLDLAAGSRARLRDLIVVVTHAAADPLLQAEAAARGALFFAAPIDPPLLLAVIAQALEARGPRPATRARRWPRTRLTTRLDATVDATPARVVDVSYGGAMVEMRQPAGAADGPFDIVCVAEGAPALPARRAWSRSAGADGPWWYGLDFTAAAPADASAAWRAFVDRIGDLR